MVVRSGDGDGLLCGNVLGYIHNPKTRPFDGGGFLVVAFAIE